jgi:integrase
MKARTGSIVKRKPRRKGAKPTWWARVTYIDPKTGKRHDLQRRGESKAQARDLLQALLRDIDATDGQGPLSERKTFAELCDYFEKNYVKAAEYVDGRKVAGVRSLGTAKGQLNVLRDYFGSCCLRSITHGDVRQFRAARLAQETRTKSQRTIASVNRELSMLRRMLNVAQREGWILRNPFAAGDSLISLADENKRERILTREEEVKLLAACGTPQRAHLKPILICALDTGMRQGEIFSLRWRNVDFENGLLNIQAFHTKTMKERQVAITTRLALELEQLKATAPENSDSLVFGIVDNVKRSFGAARSNAGLKDVRFHDLRHTAATRLVGAHIPLSEVGRLLGHTQANTTYRHVNANVETAKRAAAALNMFNSEGTAEPESAEMVN